MADNWNSGVSDNWTNGSDWSTGSTPTSSDDATISAAGSYTVTINSSVAADSLTINDADATVADTNGGTLAIATTLAITAGTFVLGSGSTLSGGTVSLGSSGIFVAAGGMLNGVTFQGALDLSAANATLYAAGGLTFEGSSGSGAGTINLTGDGAALLYSGNGTLDGATVNIGSAAGSYLDGSGGTLILGTGTTLVQDGTAYLGGDESGETFVNLGTITAGTAAGYFGVEGPGLTNAGTIAVSNGDTFDMSSLASFTNTGSMSAAGTGTVMSFGGAWTNSGSLLVSSFALVNLGGNFNTRSLSGITVSTGGLLDITGDLTNTSATLVLGSGSALGAVELSGTITGGTIADAGGGIIADGGTLNGVTYQGVLDLSASNALLYAAGNVEVEAAGGGAGTINLTGNEAALIYTGSATLDNATVDLGSLDGSYLDGQSGTLTLGPGANLVQTGAQAYLGGYVNAEAFVNLGLITAGYSGGYFSISGPGFTNAGEIAVANGDTTSIYSTAWTNTGTITATGDGTLLSFGGSWTNAGNIAVGNNALLNLGGSFSTASLSGISLGAGAAVVLSGDLNNIGTTLVLGSGSALGAVMLSGTITGGTIADDGDGIIANYGTLDGLTYQGVLDLSASNAVLYGMGNLNFQGSGGSGTGTIDLTGNGAALLYSGSGTINNAIINIGNGGGSYLDGDGGTLIFGSGTTLIQAGAQAYLGGIYNTETFVNQGALIAGYSGGSFSISGPAFTNTGSIVVSNGDILTMAGLTSFTNLNNSTLTGGSYEVDAGSTFQILDNASIVTDAATLILSGVSANITSLNTTTGQKTRIDQTLVTISSTGTLELLSGRNFAASAAFTDNGLLQLGGVTFNAASGLHIGAAGSLYGFGTVEGTVADSGNITASGGTLGFSAAVSGAGSLVAVAGSTIELIAGGALTEAISGAGTLQLAGTSAHTLAAGASIGIANVQVNAKAILSGAGSISGAVSDAGTVSATGGTFVLDGPISGAGVLSAASGAVLDLAGGGAFSGAVQGSGTLRLDGANAFTLQTGAVLSIAAVVIDAGAILDLTGGGKLSSKFSGAGTLQLDRATPYTLAGGTIGNATLDIDSGAALSGFGTISGSVTNAGTITASGGTLHLTGPIAGGGGLVAAAGAVLDLTTGGTLGGNISGAGMLKLDGATAFIINAGAPPTISQIQVDAGATLSGSGTVKSSVTDVGTVNAAGGTLTLGAITGAGALTAANGAVIDLTAGGALTEKISGAGTLQLDRTTSYTLASATISIAALLVDSGATLSGSGNISGSVADAGTITASGGTLHLNGAVTGSGALVAAANATLDLAAGGTFGGNISGAGTLKLDGATAFTFGGGVISASQIRVDSGATLSGNGTVKGSVTDAGTLNAAGGTLTLGSITGSGKLTAAGGAEVDLTAGGALTEAISGAGTLQLDGSTAYTHAAAALTIAALTLDSGVTLSGTGSIASAITNNGTITASGGKLVLSGQIAGSGALQAAASSVLDLTAGQALDEAVSGAGTLELGGAFQIGGFTLSVANISIDAGGSLSGAGTLTSSITDAGTLAAAGGTLTVSGKLSSGGTLSAGAGAVLNLAGGGYLTGNLSGLGTVDINSALTLNQGAAFSAATIAETANVTLDANTKLGLAAGAALDMTAAANATVDLSGASTSSFINNGNVNANGAGTAEFAVAVINNANVSVGSGTLSFLGTLTNNGTIDASSGLLTVKDTVGGTGTLQIGATGTMSLLLGAGTGQTVDFLAGTGLLDLTKPIDFTGLITGFAGGDVIDLLKAPETGYSFSNNVLTINDGANIEASLHCGSGYTSADFSVTKDMNGGTFIKFV